MNPRALLAATVGIAVVGVAVLVYALIGGFDPPPRGPTGRVVEKDLGRRGSPSGIVHFLTVETPGGDVHEFEVTSEHYHRCHRGSWYPSCTARTDRY